MGDAWRVKRGLSWQHYRKVDCTLVIAVDWAQAGKKDSNKTAIVTAAITEDGLVLPLHVVNETLRYEENAPVLADACERCRDLIAKHSDGLANAVDLVVASDDDMLSDAMAVDCRSQVDDSGRRLIPEIKRLPIRSKAKIIRAQAAIIRSQNGLFLLPDIAEPWQEETCDQLAAFTGEDGAEDDIADCFGILGRLAEEFAGSVDDEYEPVLGATGYGNEEVQRAL